MVRLGGGAFGRAFPTLVANPLQVLVGVPCSVPALAMTSPSRRLAVWTTLRVQVMVRTRWCREPAKLEPSRNEPTTSGQSVNENTVVSSQQVREQHSSQEVPRGALAAVDAGQKNALALTDNGPEEQALAVVEQDQATEGDVVTKKVEAPKTDPLPIFEPEEEWKRILPGQQIPGGLDVRMNLQTGEKFARLMPESSSSAHWSNKRKRNLKGEDQGVTDETIMVADHIRPSQNKTKPGNGKNMRLDINDVSEDDLSPLDPGMKSAQMIERVLNRLPMPPEELKSASKLSPEKYKEVMQLLWKKGSWN